MSRALIITYHAIEAGPPPLYVHPELFQLHVESVLSEGARILNVSALVQELAEPTGTERLVALTFDDGFSSVARNAAPILSSYGVSATVFCVAGHVGGRNDWPTDRPGGAAGADRVWPRNPSGAAGAGRRGDGSVPGGLTRRSSRIARLRVS